MNTRDPIPKGAEFNREFEFLDLEALLDRIPGPNGAACRQLYADYKELMDTAPGASNNHHVWEGGYRDHIAQTMNLFRMQFADAQQYGWFESLPEDERFSEGDGLTVLFLHDLEKPFKYRIDDNGDLVDDPRLADKELRKEFRAALIEEYDIELNENQQNAMKYVEGVRDGDYRQGERVDKPLAAMVHACDLLSARMLYALRSSGQGEGSDFSNTSAVRPHFE